MAKCKKCVNLHNVHDVSDGIGFKWCQKKMDDPDIELERECEYYRMRTQADRIRSMTNEELADFIKGLNDVCLAGLGAVDCSQKKCSNCEEIVLEWLQSPVEV